MGHITGAEVGEAGTACLFDFVCRHHLERSREDRLQGDVFRVALVASPIALLFAAVFAWDGVDSAFFFNDTPVVSFDVHAPTRPVLWLLEVRTKLHGGDVVTLVGGAYE